MSSTTFLTLPREIRDQIYEYFWELEQVVTPWARHSDAYHPWEKEPADVSLSLFYINHQISAEAMVVFYSKRTFRLNIRYATKFLREVPLRQHLIRHISYYRWEFSGWLLKTQDDKFIEQSYFFPLIRSMSGLQSLLVDISDFFDDNSFKRVLGYLDRHGIPEILDCTNFTIQRHLNTTLNHREDDWIEVENGLLKETLTWAKDEKKWNVQGYQCLLWDKEGKKSSFRPCDHDNHRTVRRILDEDRGL